MESALKRAAGLAIWTGPVSPEPLGGGLTNVNFIVEDAGPFSRPEQRSPQTITHKVSNS